MYVSSRATRPTKFVYPADWSFSTSTFRTSVRPSSWKMRAAFPAAYPSCITSLLSRKEHAPICVIPAPLEATKTFVNPFGTMHPYGTPCNLLVQIVTSGDVRGRHLHIEVVLVQHPLALCTIGFTDTKHRGIGFVFLRGEIPHRETGTTARLDGLPMLESSCCEFPVHHRYAIAYDIRPLAVISSKVRYRVDVDWRIVRIFR